MVGSVGFGCPGFWWAPQALERNEMFLRSLWQSDTRKLGEKRGNHWKVLCSCILRSFPGRPMLGNSQIKPSFPLPLLWYERLGEYLETICGCQSCQTGSGDVNTLEEKWGNMGERKIWGCDRHRNRRVYVSTYQCLDKAWIPRTFQGFEESAFIWAFTSPM